MNTAIPVILLSSGLVSMFFFNGMIAAIFLSAAGVAWVIDQATDRVVKRLKLIDQATDRVVKRLKLIEQNTARAAGAEPQG